MTATLKNWNARLALSFSKSDSTKTVLAKRKHHGPLQVQKALYPEGPGVCHVAILHPPSGVAGGDALSIDIALTESAHALLSTPGATRWYKANDRYATQNVVIHLDAHTRLDWLPQESIFFEQANARVSTQIHLQAGACAIGWEILQLGSIVKPGHWEEGSILLNTQLLLEERPLWVESGELHAKGRLRDSHSGLAGFPVSATLWAFGPALTSGLIERLAETMPWNDTLRAGVTALPPKDGQGLNLVRVLGQHVEDVKRFLIELWMTLRPLILETRGAYLRLWNT